MGVQGLGFCAFALESLVSVPGESRSHSPHGITTTTKRKKQEIKAIFPQIENINKEKLF